MSHDAIAALGRAISAPVATMTVVTVESVMQAGGIIRTVSPSLEDRPWAELAMPCTAGQTGALLKAAREMTFPWPPEAGVLFLVDDTPPNRTPEEGVAFWRAMNLQRETWGALNCHLVFLLTPQNQAQLLTVADHLAAWIPIKLDARRPGDTRMIQEMQPAAFFEPGGRNREEARQRLEELERGLAEALANDEAAGSTAMLRRFYLPMLEAALDAHDLTRADGLRLTIPPQDVPDADKQQWWRAVCQTLLRLYRLEEARTEAERYLAWAEQSKNVQAEGEACNTLAEILRTLGNFAGARALLERALKIAEAAYGPEHPKVATAANNLGLVLHDLGNFTGARVLFEHALKIDEAVYGPNNPELTTGVNNLGRVLLDLGELAVARTHLERALAIAETACGPTHPEVAILVNNLGRVLQDLGDLLGARMHFERALEIDEAIYGLNHPNTAILLGNLGRVLQDLGDLSGARACSEKALAIDEAAYGPDHPSVATDFNNLGSILNDLGDLPGARACFERALVLFRATLGESHPKTMIVAENLAALGK